jgi:hypothetical protein
VVPEAVVLDRDLPLDVGEVYASDEVALAIAHHVLGHGRDTGQGKEHPEHRLGRRLSPRVSKSDGAPGYRRPSTAGQSRAGSAELPDPHDHFPEEDVERRHAVQKRLGSSDIEGRSQSSRAPEPAHLRQVGFRKRDTSDAKTRDRAELRACGYRDVDGNPQVPEGGRAEQVGGGPSTEDAGRGKEKPRSSDAQAVRLRQVGIGVDAAVEAAPGGAPQRVACQQSVTQDVARPEDASAQLR